MKLKILFFLLSACWMICPRDVNAQVANVIGNVTNQDGEALPGVTVAVQGTDRKTITSADGTFRIEVPSSSTVLLFSTVGYEPQERNVSGFREINVIMVESSTDLDEVVVVGYGTQKRVNVIGSVVTVGSRELSAAPVGNATNAIAGRLPGAIIQQGTGEPGNDGASILIRGLATMGDGRPLIVIDGIPGRDLDAINPSDIESISVLKDASAAIYGARAANGVILVTTKKGAKSTPLTVNYNFYQGFLSPTQLPKMTDAVTYAQMIREVQTYAGDSEPNMRFSPEDIEKYRSGEYPWTHPNTDWFKAALAKQSPSSNHNVSLSGGSDAVDYFMSFGSQNDKGIFNNSSTSYNRYNVKATFDAKLNKYLSLGLDVNGIQENRDYPSIGNSNNFRALVENFPTSPAYYPNGLPGPDIAYGYNPVVSSTDATGFDQGKVYRANTIFSAMLAVPGIEGLSVSSYYAYDLSFGQGKLFETPWILYELDRANYLAAGNTGKEDGSEFLIGSSKGFTEPRLTNYYDDGRTKTINVKADYTKSFGHHHLSAFVSYEASDFTRKETQAFRRYFISDQLPYLFAGGEVDRDNSERVWTDARKNYFGRISYDFNETYLFQFSFRRDGSLRFSKEAGRWGNFPSVLAGWKVSNEKFWQDHVKFIDFFKLKASWGMLGNDLIAPFQYLSVYSQSSGAVIGSDKVYYYGLRLATEANPYITWETAKIYNLGFESMWLSNKLTFNADFFYQKRNDILIARNASVPAYTGLVLPDENFGIVDNRGFELVLGYADHVNDFRYSVSGNLAFARNKVIEFDEAAGKVEWLRLTGKPLGTQALYRSLGIFRDEAHVNSLPHVSGARPGDIIIEDYDGDGQITADDRMLYPKTADPEITYGVNFNFSYKNLSLTGLIQGTGHSMRRMYYEYQGMSGNYFAYDAEGRWTPDNIDASKPRAFDRNDAYWRSSYVTDYSYQSGAYARLKNLQLSYDLSTAVQHIKPIKGLSVYLSGQNLLMLYSANKILDPEVGAHRSGSIFRIYPIMRTIAIGARITL